MNKIFYPNKIHLACALAHKFVPLPAMNVTLSRASSGSYVSVEFINARLEFFR